MKNINQLFQTYKQAPWRTQLQYVGLVLAALVSLAIVSAFYVNVTTRTALAGREISNVKTDIAIMQQNISDLESKVAALTSTRIMQERATALGFIPAGPEEFTFIYVSGYTPRSAIRLAPKPVHDPGSIILPEYSESLFDWFTNRGRP
jgi:hypothetical protein